MPSAAVGNNAVQCAIPDLGNGSHSEAMKQFLGVIDKKVRNMEKKKVHEQNVYIEVFESFSVLALIFVGVCACVSVGVFH